MKGRVILGVGRLLDTRFVLSLFLFFILSPRFLMKQTFKLEYLSVQMDPMLFLNCQSTENFHLRVSSIWHPTNAPL
jgi:hypothetical protein